MRIFLLFSILLLTVYCAPMKDESKATILFYDNKNYANGNYSFSYSTSNGIFREEQGTLVNKGEPNEHIAVRGSFSYPLPDGSFKTVEYTADENGYQYSSGNPLDFREDYSPALVASLLGK